MEDTDELEPFTIQYSHQDRIDHCAIFSQVRSGVEPEAIQQKCSRDRHTEVVVGTFLSKDDEFGFAAIRHGGQQHRIEGTEEQVSLRPLFDGSHNKLLRGQTIGVGVTDLTNHVGQY
ncbi:hypothetical protein D3C78_1607190 [compost metagenome]